MNEEVQKVELDVFTTDIADTLYQRDDVKALAIVVIGPDNEGTVEVRNAGLSLLGAVSLTHADLTVQLRKALISERTFRDE